MLSKLYSFRIKKLVNIKIIRMKKFYLALLLVSALTNNGVSAQTDTNNGGGKKMT